jgi:transcriptional regulator with XRE-family HTH domain
MTSEEFKEIRLSLGMTQVELGRRMGMMVAGQSSCPAIHRIETSRKPTAIHAAFIREIQENEIYR